jgi:asparagine synthase (glutamine-hydrolysing)
MNETLKHRGPNDHGSFIKDHIGLAMRRLSIIDLESGKQPIHNEDRSIWIVFNGEIYNYMELRLFLEKKGHVFYTRSDTETIVHLYEEFGEECVSYLRGMFAFALWDNNLNSLLLVRDRLGIKPLFYSIIKNSRLVFASELKALLHDPEVETRIDFQSLDLFFTYGYIPAPFSIYKNIRKVLPGHLVNINSNGVFTKKYWDLHFCPDSGKSESYFIDRFEEIFADSVKMRLISEVPLGAFLSGGIDSSLVVSQMADAMTDAPNTYTVGFSGNVGGFLDERPFARILSEKYDCNHREIEVAPEINLILGNIVDAFDEPFADDSVIPSYYICQFAKKTVTVALTGLGGDELFAGYERYLGFQLSLFYDYFPKFISKILILPIINSLPEQRSGHYLANHMKRFIRASSQSLPERYASYVSSLEKEKRKELFAFKVADQIDFNFTTEFMTSYFNSSDNALEPMDRMLYQDIKTYLPDDILTLTDRIGMLHSLELRVPFTDHVLMEFCATIPANLKIKKFKKKYLLRKIAQKHIPNAVISHRKQGFASPMAAWLKTDLKPLCNELLSPERIGKTGIFNVKFIQRILNEHLSRKELHDRLIFSLIIFQIWLDRNKGCLI